MCLLQFLPPHLLTPSDSLLYTEHAQAAAQLQPIHSLLQPPPPAKTPLHKFYLLALPSKMALWLSAPRTAPGSSDTELNI